MEPSQRPLVSDDLIWKPMKVSKRRNYKDESELTCKVVECMRYSFNHDNQFSGHKANSER